MKNRQLGWCCAQAPSPLHSSESGGPCPSDAPNRILRATVGINQEIFKLKQRHLLAGHYDIPCPEVQIPHRSGGFPGLYLYLTSHHSQSLPLVAQLQRSIGIEASPDIYEEAIAYAAKNLAVELDIELENYDLSKEEYQEIMAAATSKFGDCHQYRLYALAPAPYSCYTCVSRPKVMLSKGQTFKIGQTCGTEKSRYTSGLPETGLILPYRI